MGNILPHSLQFLPLAWPFYEKRNKRRAPERLELPEIDFSLFLSAALPQESGTGIWLLAALVDWATSVRLSDRLSMGNVEHESYSLQRPTALRADQRISIDRKIGFY